MVAHLATKGNHLSVFIQEQQVAVAPHDFEHHMAFHCIPRAIRKLETHDPFKTLLLDLHEGELAKAVLALLRQGAAAALFRRRRDLDQARAVGFPAELQPHHALEGAESQLKGLAIGLLCLLKATRQHAAAQVTHHRSQGGDVHGLGRGQAHR